MYVNIQYTYISHVCPFKVILPTLNPTDITVKVKYFLFILTYYYFTYFVKMSLLEKQILLHYMCHHRAEIQIYCASIPLKSMVKGIS